MPIRDKSLYPADWKTISKRIRFERAGGRCEWCGAPHGRTILRSIKDPTRYVILGDDDYYYLTPEYSGLRELPEDFVDTGDNGVKIVLTVAHLDHDTTHNEDSNLAALCQRCHLQHDAKLHATHARKTRAKHRHDKKIADGQLELLDTNAAETAEGDE